MKIKGLISIFLFFIIGTFCFRCKIPYYRPETPRQTNYLVVEGYISSNIPTVIKLSRTRVVSQFDTARIVAETNAKIIVQNDHADRYSLEETAPGTYTMGTVSLDSSYKYSLYISTSSGREYQSDFVPFRSSPPITGIDWNLLQNDLQVYVKTQTLPNKTPIITGATRKPGNTTRLILHTMNIFLPPWL